MISDCDLQRWDDFLAEQMLALDAAYLAATGQPHRASPELVAFLKMNNNLVKDRVEEALAEFASAQTWPSSLSADQIANLTHRAHAARGLLQAILNRQIKNVGVLHPPRANDRPRFIRWLLIDNWNRGGGAGGVSTRAKGSTFSAFNPAANEPLSLRTRRKKSGLTPNR
jgi:hypothetical protein